MRWVWLRARYSHRESGRRYRFGVIADITERKQAEAALEASRREAYRQWTELEAIYQTAPIGLSLYSADEFRYLRVNDVQMGVIGLPQVVDAFAYIVVKPAVVVPVKNQSL